MISPAGIWWITGAALLVFLWLVYRYSLFEPAPQGLPILLYHKVSPQENDGLTISADRLDGQLAFVKDRNYTPISFSELSDAFCTAVMICRQKNRIPADIRRRVLEAPFNWCIRCCSKHQVKATIFLPVGFIGGVNQWDDANESLMSYQDIREIAGRLVEFGLHSYRHENYEHYSAGTNRGGCDRMRARARRAEVARLRESSRIPMAACPESKASTRLCAIASGNRELSLRCGSARASTGCRLRIPMN